MKKTEKLILFYNFKFGKSLDLIILLFSFKQIVPVSIQYFSYVFYPSAVSLQSRLFLVGYTIVRTI